MGLRQKVKLELDDGREIEVAYDGRDLRAWETAFGASTLTESMSLSMLTWLGHHAGVRQGLIDGELKSYKAFDEVCVSVQGVRDEERPTTPPAPQETAPAADTPTTASDS